MFISALSTSKINEAFRLCSVNDNFSIKKGQQMLKDMRKDPGYFVMLANYITNKEVSLHDHMRAALEIEKTVDRIFNDQIEERYEEVFGPLCMNLVSIYLTCEEQVANILRSVLLVCGFSLEMIKYLASMDNGSYMVKLRILKLYSKAFKDLEDDTLVEYADQLAAYILNELQIGVNLTGRVQPLPTVILYQMVKILVLYTDNFSTPFDDQEFTRRYTAVLKAVLNLPVDSEQSQKQFKMKGQAFNCLNFLVNVVSEGYDTLIDHFKYIVSVKRKSQELAKYCLSYYLAYLNKMIERHPEEERSAALKEILQTAILMCYDPEHMYKALKEDHSYFISVYCQCLSDQNCSTSACRKIFRTIIKKYQKMWLQMLETGRKGGDPTELLMCFVCESAMICSPDGVIRHTIPAPILDSFLQDVYEKNLQPLNVDSGVKHINLDQNQLLRVTCSLRVLFHYRNYITIDKLRKIMYFCSKLAQKNDVLRFLCYYVICKMLEVINPNHCEGNAQSDNLYVFDDRIPELTEIAHVLLEDASSNTFSMTMDDLKFAYRILDIINNKFEIVKTFQKPLKQLALAALYFCENGGDDELMEKILLIPSTYSLAIRFEKEFTQPLLKIIDKKIVNSRVAELYIDYMKTGADDPKSVAQMYKQMSSAEFWLNNQELGYMYIPVLILLTSKNEENIFENMSKTLTFALDVVDNLCKNARYDKAQLIGLMILSTACSAPYLHKKIEDLYSILFNSSKKSPRLNSLMLHMMATHPHPRESTRYCCIDRICYALKKMTLKELEFKPMTSILFVYFEQYFVPNDPQSWKKWGQLFEAIMKAKQINEKEKKKVVSLFYKFQEKYKPDICKILKEKFQILLTTWMFEFSSVNDTQL